MENWIEEPRQSIPDWFRKKLEDDGMDFKLFLKPVQIEKMNQQGKKIKTQQWEAKINIWIVNKKKYWNDPDCGKEYMDTIGYTAGGTGSSRRKSTAKMNAIKSFQSTRWF